MADTPDIKILVGISGDGSVNGDSGKLIREQLEKVAKGISAKPIEVAFTLDSKTTEKNIQAQLRDLSKSLTADVKLNFGEAGSASSKGPSSIRAQIAKEQVLADKQWMQAEDTRRKQATAAAKQRTNEVAAAAAKAELLKRNALSDEKLDVWNQRVVKVSQLAQQTGIADTRVQELASAFNALQKANGTETQTAAMQKLLETIASVKAEADSLNASLKKNTQELTLQQQIARKQADVEDIGQKWSALLQNPAYKSQYDSLVAWSKALQTKDDLTAFNRELATFTARMQAAGANTQSFGDKLKASFSKFSSWLGVSTIVMTAISAIKQMIANVNDLSTATVNLQVASGKTKTEVEKLMTTYAEMGKQLGATALEVADSADTWLRQGYNVADANSLIRNSMMLSKLGQLDAAAAAKDLTSAMKGYGYSVEDAVKIVDMLTAVDMKAAVSAGDIAEAMSETAVSAKMAGVSMERLIGYLTSVMEVTQGSPEEIGNYFKTIFARMGQVKQGRLVDPETDEDLSNVETALDSLGIKLRDGTKNFRDFDVVLDDVFKKWGTWNEVQKRSIANAFGLTRQQERFLVLMDNYAKATDYATVATDSAGTATSKYQDYLSGTEAAIKSFTAQFQAFSQSVIGSGLISGTVNFGTGILGVFTALNKTLGSAAIILPTIIGLLSKTQNIGNSNEYALYLRAA